MSVRLYKVQLVKNGPQIPLRIWFGHPVDPVTGETLTERPAIWRAIMNGRELPIERACIELMPDSWSPGGVNPVVKGEQITQADYDHYVRLNRWAIDHAPNEPEATPREAIDMNKMKPIRW